MNIQLRIHILYNNNYAFAIRHNIHDIVHVLSYVVANGRIIIIWILLVMLCQIARLK